MSRSSENILETSLPSPVPLIIENMSASKDPKESLLGILDEVEIHVERLRRDAVKLEEEKDSLFTTLDTLKHSQVLQDLNENDRDDIERYADRVATRCATIDVCVKTSRDKTQEDALCQVNILIDNLVKGLKNDPDGTKERCRIFLNTCTSYGESGYEDKNFEVAILGCTADDQKRVRRRLQGLMDYMEKLSVVSS